MINTLRQGSLLVRLSKNILGFSTVSAKDLKKTNKLAVDDIKTVNPSAPLLDVPKVIIIIIIMMMIIIIIITIIEIIVFSFFHP